MRASDVTRIIELLSDRGWTVDAVFSRGNNYYVVHAVEISKHTGNVVRRVCWLCSRDQLHRSNDPFYLGNYQEEASVSWKQRTRELFE